MKHERSLDGLRALAATGVVLFHVGFPLSGGGIRGVDIFFVLSGFLITSLLMDADRGYVDFWVRRLRRLMPALALFLATYVLVVPFVLPSYASTRWTDAAFALFYISDQATAFRAMHGLGHAWSLAVEGQFYLLWPLVVKGLKRMAATKASNLLLIAWVIVTCVRDLVFLKLGWHSAYYPSELHCTGLLLGAAIAFRPWPARFGLVGAAMLCVLFVIERTPDSSGPILWSIPLAELGTALVIASLTHDTVLRRALAWKPLSTFGLLSYGIYLWHHPLSLIFFDQRWFIKGPVVLISATILSAISYLTVEALFRKRRGPRGAVASETHGELSMPQPTPSPLELERSASRIP
jgi:peptidoglycan/LPS O-acetylase OafA/YrhL